MGKSEIVMKSGMKTGMKSGTLQDMKRKATKGIEPATLGKAPVVGSPAALTAAMEVRCARAFNVELPQDLGTSVTLLEARIRSLFDCEKSVILTYDEVSCTYTCINDLKRGHTKPRELTLIDDHFLQELLESEEILYTLFYNPSDGLSDIPAIGGIIALAAKRGTKAFTPEDEALLDLATPYISNKVQAFQTLKANLSLPFIQSVLLEVSNRLISAVDQETIMISVLESLESRLDIDACQYVALQNNSDVGEVLFESHRGKIKNYTKPHRQHGKKAIPQLTSLMSLFQSMARRTPYLLLNHKMLGDKPLEEWFGVQNIQTALILPVLDVSTRKPVGILNLFKTRSDHFAPETLDVGKQVSVLVSLALGRVRNIEQTLVLATSDELTGLTNRRGFYERFEIEIERARRNPSSMCVALIDVDHFKRLNDSRGHLSGDLVLQALAESLNKNVRKSDMVCRFGGEEFVLLLPDTSEKSAFDLLERIRRKVAKHKILDAHGNPLKITISAGLAVVGTQDYGSALRQIIDSSIEDADKQLYRAKAQGRNQVCSTRMESSVVQCELPFLNRS